MRSEGKGYRLVPAQVPVRRRESFYSEIINEFKGGKAQVVLVDETDKKPVTLVQGLRKALQSEGNTAIGVLQRRGGVYLVRSGRT
jgi:hypothetical protein